MYCALQCAACQCVRERPLCHTGGGHANHLGKSGAGVSTAQSAAFSARAADDMRMWERSLLAAAVIKVVAHRQRVNNVASAAALASPDDEEVNLHDALLASAEKECLAVLMDRTAM